MLVYVILHGESIQSIYDVRSPLKAQELTDMANDFTPR